MKGLDAWITGNYGEDHPDNVATDEHEEDTMNRTLEEDAGVIVNESGIDVGDRVRSFDFESRDIDGPKAYYIEGTVVELVMFQGCARYRIKSEIIVRAGDVASFIPKDFEYILPPINGTPKLMGGECEGVELIVKPFTWGMLPQLRQKDNGVWVVSKPVDEETSLQIHINHNWSDDDDDLRIEVCCSTSPGFELRPEASRSWRNKEETPDPSVVFYENDDVWGARIFDLLDSWQKLQGLATMCVS